MKFTTKEGSNSFSTEEINKILSNLVHKENYRIGTFKSKSELRINELITLAELAFISSSEPVFFTGSISVRKWDESILKEYKLPTRIEDVLDFLKSHNGFYEKSGNIKFDFYIKSGSATRFNQLFKHVQTTEIIPIINHYPYVDQNG